MRDWEGAPRWCPPVKGARSQRTDTTQKASAQSRGVDAPRRRWSEAHKRRVVADSYRSGETVSEVAQRHGVHSSLLFRWRRPYRKAPDTVTGFVAVVVEAPEAVSAAGAGRMEIVLGEDVRVVVDATVHAGALARVLTVVSGR